MLLSLYRTTKYAFVDFWRNIWLSLITVTMMVFALISVNVLIFFSVVSNAAITTLEDKVDVSIFFKREVNDNQIYELETKMVSMDEVKEAKIISKEESLALFKENHKNDATIIASLEEIGYNPLGATLVVKAKSPEFFPLILAVLEDPKFALLIAEKNFTRHQLVIDKITEISAHIKRMVVGMSIIFICIAIIIIFNTIRMAIYTHRDEIRIMKLVGASNWFVEFPFLIQALFFSILSVAASLALVYWGIFVLNPYIVEFFGSINLDLLRYFSENFWLLAGSQGLVAALLSVFSSSYAVSKYVRA
ncbi:MAG: cell division transport system permease protein [Parcubacteria group bacterium Gr01-1014_18]|nr:MAG: cell division transport system permease protein [Parcubacteria group bacterium Greene0416_36]TSC81098.1 MAG: cell division transport system permease protein [Parcubacteria group bacterium Gr01-1014_18]TSC98486.1 MAG: cell division transport system permease protein [Parcubacteria group bacterium Greene1014_20]TSD07349.1 MAG: cell division transport system permease protein [Parcubacteria group bacterium Greene0714_2]